MSGAVLTNYANDSLVTFIYGNATITLL